MVLAGTALLREEDIADKEILKLERDEARNELLGLSHIRNNLAAAGLDPNEIVTLIASTMERARFSSEVEKNLRSEISELKPLAEAGRAMKELQDKTGLTPKALARLKEEFDAQKPLADVGREYGEIEKDTGVSLDQLREKGDDLKGALDAGAQLALQEDKLTALQREVARLSAVANSKGIDPSCWYHEIISDSGDVQERMIPLFDVAVFDEHLLVRDRPAPEKYAGEKRLLPLAPIKFMEPLSDEDFRRMMRPIRQMAKVEKALRPYSCVFYVNVWDKTSPDSKERWKRANKTIGSAYYRDTVWSESWEGSDE